MSASQHAEPLVADEDRANLFRTFIAAPLDTTLIKLGDFLSVEVTPDDWAKFSKAMAKSSRVSRKRERGASNRATTAVNTSSMPTDSTQPSEAERTNRTPESELRGPPICDESIDSRWYAVFMKKISECGLQNTTVVDYQLFRSLAEWLCTTIGPSGQTHFQKCMKAAKDSPPGMIDMEAQINRGLEAGAQKFHEELLTRVVRNNYKLGCDKAEDIRLGCLFAILMTEQWEALKVQWDKRGSQEQQRVLAYSEMKGRSTGQGTKIVALGTQWMIDLCEHGETRKPTTDEGNDIKTQHFNQRSLGHLYRVLYQVFRGPVFYFMANSTGLRKIKGREKVKVLKASCEVTVTLFPELSDSLTERLKAHAASSETLEIDGPEILRTAFVDDKSTESDTGSVQGDNSRGPTPAVSPTKSSHAGGSMSDDIYVDEDVRMEDANKHGKRGLQSGDGVHEDGVADKMKKLKVAVDKHEGTANTKTTSREVQRKTSKPVLVEGQENQEYEAYRMANRWT